MNRALAWIRSSQGSEDDVGYEEQLELVLDLAHEIADEVDILDLGIQTGFSSMTRDDDPKALDRNNEVIGALEDIRDGRYDFLIGYDDRRICRDDYLKVIEYACKEGESEIKYVADVEEDDLTFDIHRRIERETKEEEIRKAKSALNRRRELGYDEGRPRWGTQYDTDGAHLVPDPETFEDALLAIKMNESTDPEFSYREIVSSTEISSTGTLKNILEQEEWYRDLASEHDMDWPPVLVDSRINHD